MIYCIQHSHPGQQKMRVLQISWVALLCAPESMTSICSSVRLTFMALLIGLLLAHIVCLQCCDLYGSTTYIACKALMRRLKISHRLVHACSVAEHVAIAVCNLRNGFMATLRMLRSLEGFDLCHGPPQKMQISIQILASLLCCRPCHRMHPAQ